MTPRLFVSLCTGMGATFRALVGGVRPVSSGEARHVPVVDAPTGYMGGKNRWAAWHLEALGVDAGAGAGHVLLADGGPLGWVWPVLLDPELSASVAQQLREVADEDPRELWEALAEWPVAKGIATATAQWLWLQARSASSTPLWHDGKGWVMCYGGRKAFGPATQRGVWSSGSPSTSTGMQSTATLADRIGALHRTRPACQRGTGAGQNVGMQHLEVAGARVEAIQAAATWLVLQAGARGSGPIYVDHGGAWRMGSSRKTSQPPSLTSCGGRDAAGLADRIEGLTQLWTQPVSVWSGRVEDLYPEGDHSETVVVFDPPYLGATGYALDCERLSVVGTALRWDDCGAAVLVCEAEPIQALVDAGWHAYDVGVFGRKGSKPEWVTMNRPATAQALARLAQLQSEQIDLFEQRGAA